MHHSLIAPSFQCSQQTPHVPLGDAQLFSRLLLCDQLLLRLFQGHQAVPLGLRHQYLSFFHLPSLKVVNRTFLLCANRTLSLCADTLTATLSFSCGRRGRNSRHACAAATVLSARVAATGTRR